MLWITFAWMALLPASSASALTSTVASSTIYSPRTLPAATSAVPTPGPKWDVSRGWAEGHQALKRDDYGAGGQCCDDFCSFNCNAGACFTGVDGAVGCCTLTTGCIPKTTCIDYQSSIGVALNPNVVGFLYCSDPIKPSCNTLTNVVASQYSVWCDYTGTNETVSYANLFTGGSHVNHPTSSVDSDLIAFLGWTTEPSVSVPIVVWGPTITAPTVHITPVTFDVATPSTTADDGSGVANVRNDGDGQNRRDILIGVSCALAGAVLLVLAFLGYYVWRKRHNRTRSEDQSSTTNILKLIPPNQTSSSENATSARPTTPRSFYSTNSGAWATTVSRPGSLRSTNTQQMANSTPMSQEGRRFVTPTEIADKPVRLEAPGDDSATELPTTPTHAELEGDRPKSTAMLSTIAEESAKNSPVTPNGRFDRNQYTPSNYRVELQSSVVRDSDHQPPSLPQPYSVASFASDFNEAVQANRRGSLSLRDSSFAYLSPEVALGGGWVNGEGSPRQEDKKQ